MFGDIDLQAHRDWVEGVCEIAGLDCHLPLWQEPRRRLLDEFLGGGARPPSSPSTPPSWAPSSSASSSTTRVIARLEAAGVDACGEEGEYHTMVTAAPLFSRPVPLVWDGVDERDGHWVLHYVE